MFTFREAVPFRNNKKSSFLVTIDTASCFAGNDSEETNHILRVQKQLFTDFLKDTFENFDQFLQEYRLVNETHDTDTLQRIPTNKNDIINGRVENSIEIGPRFKKLHSHTLVTIEHPYDTAFKVDIYKLREYCYDFFGKKVWVQLRYIKDNEPDLINYIAKMRKEADALRKFGVKDKTITRKVDPNRNTKKKSRKK